MARPLIRKKRSGEELAMPPSGSAEGEERRGSDRAEGAVDLERRSHGLDAEALGQVHLIDVARGDVIERPLDHGFIAWTGEGGGDDRRSGCGGHSRFRAATQSLLDDVPLLGQA